MTLNADAESVDGYDIQKNGTDGSGIINFKTSSGIITIDGTEIAGATINEDIQEITIDGVTAWQRLTGAKYIYAGGSGGTLHKIDSEGNEIWTRENVSNTISAIEVDSNGNIFVGDHGGNVKKYLSDNTFEWEYQGHTEFESINHLAIGPNDYIYSASADNEVHKINQSGNNEWKYTGHGSYVNCVGVDSNGNVYSGDSNNEVHKISGGSQDWIYTEHEDKVEALAIGPNDFIYSGAGGYLHKIDSSGNQEWSTILGAAAYDIVVDHKGFSYSALNYYSELHKLDDQNSEQWVYSGHSSGLQAVAVSETSDVYSYSGGEDNELHKVDPNGNKVWSYTNFSDYVRAISVYTP